MQVTVTTAGGGLVCEGGAGEVLYGGRGPGGGGGGLSGAFKLTFEAVLEGGGGTGGRLGGGPLGRPEGGCGATFLIKFTGRVWFLVCDRFVMTLDKFSCDW